MAAWVVPTSAPVPQWSDCLGVVRGTPIAVDASDPNTSAPDSTRVFFTPKIKQMIAGLVADLACQVEVWVYLKSMAKWVKVLAATSLTANVVSFFGNGLASAALPDNVPCFIRVVANAGSATYIGMIAR